MPWPKGRPFSAESKAKRLQTLQANGKRRKRPQMVDGLAHWRCPACASWLPESSFHHDKKTLNGLKSQCRSCHGVGSIASRNPDRYRETKRASERKRRARKAIAAVHVPHGRADLLMLREILGERCLCCGSDVAVQIDHIVPLARGGLDHPLNFQPLCRRCNEKKQARVRDYRSEAQAALAGETWPAVLSFRRVDQAP